MKLSVVMATMDRPAQVERNIESLSRSRVQPAEVVIADSNSRLRRAGSASGPHEGGRRS